MGVNLRSKKLADGRLSLYLDYYPPIKGANGRFTRREFLNRYLYGKPKNALEKSTNETNKLFADTLRLKREKEILNEQDGIFNSSNKKVDFIEFFKKVSEARRDSNSNYSNWMSSLHYLSAFTGGKCVMGDLTEEFCNRFKDYLRTTTKLNTVRGLRLSQNSALSYFNKFRAAINEAYNARFLNENPLKYVKAIPECESKREFLTQEELQKLFNTECDLHALKTAAIFSALTGLRWSDISLLTWGDIQKTETGYFLHLRQKKTADPMMHPINAKAVQILDERGLPGERIFAGLKYSDSNNDKIKRWVLRAGIDKKITLHNFRHTYATLMLNKGVDIFTVSKMLGHRDIKTTMLYAKVLSTTKINAANLVDIDL